jgi:hypothetical protein
MGREHEVVLPNTKPFGAKECIVASGKFVLALRLELYSSNGSKLRNGTHDSLIRRLTDHSSRDQVRLPHSESIRLLHEALPNGASCLSYSWICRCEAQIGGRDLVLPAEEH